MLGDFPLLSISTTRQEPPYLEASFSGSFGVSGAFSGAFSSGFGAGSTGAGTGAGGGTGLGAGSQPVRQSAVSTAKIAPNFFIKWISHSKKTKKRGCFCGLRISSGRYDVFDPPLSFLPRWARIFPLGTDALPKLAGIALKRRTDSDRTIEVGSPT